jgi:hypothetical protein
MLLILSGCLSFPKERSCSDRADAGTKAELAELLKLHRMCLQKYEGDAVKARESCMVYREAIHDLVPSHQKATVVEQLDRILKRDR